MVLKNSASLLWVLALVSGLFLVNEWQLQLFGAAFVLLVGWCCLLLGRKPEDGFAYPKSAFVYLLCGFWALVFCSVWWSDIFLHSYLGFCLISILPLTFFTLVLKGEDRDFKILFYGLAVVFGVLALWALVQYYFLIEVFDAQARHPLANPNSLAALFNLVLFAALSILLSSESRKVSNGALVYALLIFGGITATSSRAALITGGISFALLAVFAWPAVKQHWKCVGFFLAGAAGLVAFTQVGRGDSMSVVARFSRVLVEGDVADATGHRLSMWQSTLAMIQDAPFLGRGIGTFSQYYPSYMMDTDKLGAYMAHSDPLQFWAELGILGPILFYAIGIAVLIRTVRAVQKMPKGAAISVQILSVFFGVFAVMGHTHVTFNLYVVPTLFVLGLSLAWWHRQTGRYVDDTFYKSKMLQAVPEQYGAGIFIIPLVLCTGLFGSLMASEYFANAAKRAAYSQDLNGFASHITMADEVGFHLNSKPYILAVSLPLGALEAQKGALTPDEERALVADVWRYMDKAETLNPMDPRVPYYRGMTHQYVPQERLPEGAQSAEDYFLRALELNPRYLAARLALLDVYRKNGNEAGYGVVIEAGQDWIYWEPMAEQYLRRLLEYYVRQGDIDAFQAIKERYQHFMQRSEKNIWIKSQSLPARLFKKDVLPLEDF